MSGHHSPEGASPESIASGFEVTDWSMKPVVILVAATIASLILAYIVIAIMVGFTGTGIVDQSNTLPSDAAQRMPPGPLLEQNPLAESNQMLQAANQHLESYGWVDQPAGVTHIPIERAKELLLELGVDPFATQE
ncbi:hypothetical protein [Candidatus Viridilinea mediisalina]|uniref:Uncharacterized protein n=1 Tax=Candidatus Viridilinea mediisalina TaxID=2024553 RepID=A0A2A6RJV3_9CHLR|nr:hypothetical protein [Candidatus Viridilinea mediisalina]PDW03223.1 hypothetical protein CJ255_09890 [Candidatus Viridilinea mediisalina]